MRMRGIGFINARPRGPGGAPGNEPVRQSQDDVIPVK